MGGNIFPKYSSKNPLVKLIMNNYVSSLFELLSKINFNSVLDAGCGEGEIIFLLKKKYTSIDIVGIDIDEEILKISKMKNPDVMFEKQDIMDLKFFNKKFDLILCLEVLEHLGNPENAIKEIIRICKKYVIFSIPREPLWSILNMCRLSYLKDFGNTPGHIQKWSKKSFLNMVCKFVNVIDVKLPLPWIMVMCEVKENV